MLPDDEVADLEDRIRRELGHVEDEEDLTSSTPSNGSR
jgi:hypothetical protein